MKSQRNKIALTVLLTVLFAITGFAQSEFRDVNVEYVFSLPNDAWKMTVKPSSMSPNVEYVHNFRKEAHLEIRKVAVEPNTLFGEVIQEEEQKLQFTPGYVAGREANFRGAYGGRVFNFEFVRSGRTMSGRYYLLKSGARTIYVLRFTGRKNTLRSLRAETDSIARTFRLKAAR